MFFKKRRTSYKQNTKNSKIIKFVGIDEKITSSTFQFSSFLETKKKGNTPKNITLKKAESEYRAQQEAPMHDTTNTCSCDWGVRATVPSETTLSRKL